MLAWKALPGKSRGERGRAAIGIVVGQAIHQANTWMTFQNRWYVHHQRVIDVVQRNDFERAEQGLHFRWSLQLDGANDDVLTTLVAPPALIQQAKRFSNAGSVSQEDLELAAPLIGFLRLRLQKEFFGGATSGGGGHG